jgi:hypothetical protein
MLKSHLKIEKPMNLYINAHKDHISFNKRTYLLRAAERLGFGNVREYGNPPRERDEYTHVLNIQPCDLVNGTKWTGIWHIDVLLNSTLAQNYYVADALFLSSNQGLYPNPKAQILFQALDPVLHRRIEAIKQDFDYINCGTNGSPYHVERERVYNVMRKHFTHTDYGKGHEPEKYVQLYNTARVQFICSGRGPGNKPALAQRFFECLGIGPVLINWSDDIPLTGFVDGEDFMVYRNDEEMITKMRALVDSKELRDKIFYNGKRKALLYHTYEHRLISILNTITY